ncbi:MAG: hypothetical protein IPN89_06110 [Saprospiraceae bacterium]|nr:hypothetical protein [Saprospiraceae bacterium]
MLLELLGFAAKAELFNEMIEDHYETGKMINLLSSEQSKVLKALPADDDNFIVEHYPDDETTKLWRVIAFRTLSEDKTLLNIIERCCKTGMLKESLFWI